MYRRYCGKTGLCQGAPTREVERPKTATAIFNFTRRLYTGLVSAEPLLITSNKRPQKKQCPDTELEAGRFAVAPFQFGQENGPFLPGSRFSHDLAAVQGVTLAVWCLGRAIGQQLLGGEWPRVRSVCVQCKD